MVIPGRRGGIIKRRYGMHMGRIVYSNSLLLVSCCMNVGMHARRAGRSTSLQGPG